MCRSGQTRGAGRGRRPAGSYCLTPARRTLLTGQGLSVAIRPSGAACVRDDAGWTVKPATAAPFGRERLTPSARVPGMRATAGGAAPPAGVDEASFESFYRGQVDTVYRALALTLGDVELAREATDEA